jgi:hypothetical protein
MASIILPVLPSESRAGRFRNGTDQTSGGSIPNLIIIMMWGIWQCREGRIRQPVGIILWNETRGAAESPGRNSRHNAL